MIAAVALLGYAALLLITGAARLAKVRWADRAPRMAVFAWLALIGSAIASVILGGAVLVVPTVRVSADLATLLAACTMAHERAHQRGRHHLLVGLAGSLAAAFPRIPALRQCHEQVARLAELLADDAAARAVPRLKVVEALLALAAPAPAGAAALGAGGSATGARVRRLIAAPAPIGRMRTTTGMLAVAVLAAFPLVLAAGPAAADGGMSNCTHMAAAAAMLPGRCGSAGC